MGLSFTFNIYHKALYKRKASWRALAIYLQQKCHCALFSPFLFEVFLGGAIPGEEQ